MANRRGSSWEGQVNHKGQRYRRLFPSAAEADAWALESKAKLLKGEPVDMGEGAQLKRKDGLPYTLGELIQHVYDTHWKPMASGEKMLINAKSIVSHLGAGTPVAKLTKIEIDKARAKLLADGNAPGTVNRKVAALSKALSEAEDMGIIDHKPKCKKYREAEHRVRRFTPEEERLALQFFERISMQPMADYLVLSLDTGMRQGEVLALHFGDVANGRVTVWGTGAEGQRTKSGKSRTVPLTDRAQAVIERRRGETDGKKVFHDLSQNQVGHYWGRMSETLGLDGDKQFVPHILRHEFCSRLASNGENAAVIQKLAGHSTMTVTQRYVHLFGDELDGAIERMQKPVVAEVKGDRLATLKALLAGLSKEELAMLKTLAEVD